MFPEVPVAQLNVTGSKTLVDHLGIEFTKVGKDFIEATMPVDHRTVQPMRLLHGGATVALAETMGSVASFLLVDTSTQHVVGTEIGASHIRSGKEGSIVRGVCKPLHIGRTSHVWEIRVFNADEKLVSIVRFTARVLERKK
ncbi:MAG: hotdog fold thioesterase [Bacteroidota bacterium]